MLVTISDKSANTLFTAYTTDAHLVLRQYNADGSSPRRSVFTGDGLPYTLELNNTTIEFDIFLKQHEQSQISSVLEEFSSIELITVLLKRWRGYLKERLRSALTREDSSLKNVSGLTNKSEAGCPLHPATSKECSFKPTTASISSSGNPNQFPPQIPFARRFW